MKVFVLTKQLILGPTSTQPMTVGVYSSFHKATKNISSKWTKIGEVQWGFRHEGMHYTITEHTVQ